MNHLIALNKPMFPKEDTVFDWLNSVTYQYNTLGVVQNMPEDFGTKNLLMIIRTDQLLKLSQNSIENQNN